MTTILLVIRDIPVGVTNNIDESEESWKDSTFYETPTLHDTLSCLEHYNYASPIIIAAKHANADMLEIIVTEKRYQSSQESLTKIFGPLLLKWKVILCGV